MKAVIEELLESWTTEQRTVELRQRERRADATRFVAIHSLAAHVHRLGGAALILVGADRTLESMPIVRCAYESALTAMWLAQNEAGGGAFVSEFSRQQRATERSLAKSNNPKFASAVNLPYVDAPDIASNSAAQARAFEQMCGDFDGGVDLYIYYRLMSAYSHAGLRVVEEYIRPTEDGADVASLLKTPRFESGGMWLFFLAASLIWGGTAFDYIDVARRRRSDLRRAARTIGIVRDLQLTNAAQARSSRGAPRAT
ncbi:MAG TPA: DUF5677 domain-containing protein [Nocardioidaceae bacterium]|nr:DUF5677 domain-containing protein [Nocardioidaceae bacterium]